MPKNATPAPNPKHCRAPHEFEASLFEAGVDVCRWCPAVRESAAEPVRGVDYPVGAVAQKRAA